jgi:Ca-activated chloride channel family protein
MLAQDASPNRLERSRLFIKDAIAQMAGDRIGLVDFAGDATLRSPLTLNYDALETSLEELTPRSSNRGGSLLGDAIREAANAFPDSEPGGKAIVVLSDGEDMDSFPVQAAEKAWKEHGVRVYTVGIGDAQDGARIPVVNRDQTSWLTFEGQEVWSKMDPMLLNEVAEAGGGRFVPAGTRLVDLGTFFEEWITEIDMKDRDEIMAMQSIPRFQWFAGLALALLLLESLVSERRGRPAPVSSEEALA